MSSANEPSQAEKPILKPPFLGEKYDWKEDWGETYQKRSFSKIFRCQIESPGDPTFRPKISEIELNPNQNIAYDPIWDNLAAAQAQFTPDGTGIIFVGHDVRQRRLGIKFCFQRKYGLYYLALSSTEEKTAPGLAKSAKSRTNSKEN